MARRLDLDPDRLVLVHPGARLASRRWPVQRFAELADRLVSRGWQVAITGAAAEVELAESMIAAMRRPAQNLAGMTGLGERAAAIDDSQLVVCHDSTVSHIAVGVGARMSAAKSAMVKSVS